MDWEELNHGLFTALRIQQIGMSAVLALIIVVAAFTVVATLIMVVLDKKKEIAVLKAMGAADDAILRIFLYQGGIIGALGTSIGLLIGLAVCKGLLVYGFPRPQGVFHLELAGRGAPEGVPDHRRHRHRHLPRGDDHSVPLRRAPPPCRRLPRAVTRR